MSVVELLRAYGSAFWKSPNVAVTQRGDSVDITHPGFYEPLTVPFDMMRDFDDVDAAVLMSCKPTGRHGYTSCLRREVLVRPTGDPLSEHLLGVGDKPATPLSDVRSGGLHFRLGPPSAILQQTFAGLYPIDPTALGSEFAILVEPDYVDSIRHDDLTRRLSQMGGHNRLKHLEQLGDDGAHRFLVELSSELHLNLAYWEVPEALELAAMERQREACRADLQRVGRVHDYRHVERYLRAVRVNEPRWRIVAMLSVIESFYLFQAYEGLVEGVRARLDAPGFDSADEAQLIDLIGSVDRQQWRDDTVVLLAGLLKRYVDPGVLDAVLGDTLSEEHRAALSGDWLEVARFIHALKALALDQHDDSGQLQAGCRVAPDPALLSAHVTLVERLTVAIMRGRAAAQREQPNDGGGGLR